MDNKKGKCIRQIVHIQKYLSSVFDNNKATDKKYES